MADTTFSSGTVIASSWLNDVNDYTYNAAKIVSITDYGAVSGADCSAAIQAANDAVATAGGGVVTFPIGTWIVTSNVTRSANVIWKGLSSLGSKISITNGTASVPKLVALQQPQHLLVLLIMVLLLGCVMFVSSISRLV